MASKTKKALTPANRSAFDQVLVVVCLHGNVNMEQAEALRRRGKGDLTSLFVCG